MTTITLASQQVSTISLLTQWLFGGWQLFAKSPFKLFGYLLAAIVIEGLFQLLPSPVGMFVSKWAMAIIVAALWPLVDQLAKTGRFTFKSLFKYSGWKKMEILAVVLILPFVLQIFTALLLLGSQAIPLMLDAQMGSTEVFELGIILASAAPLSTLFVFAPALILLDNQALKTSLTLSISMILSVWPAMLILCLINALLLFLAPFTFLLSALLLSPLLICVNYQAYQYLRTKNKDA